MTKPDLLTTATVAERLGLSIRTVHRLVATEQLQPVVKVPGRTGAYLFDPSDVDELLRTDERH